MEMTYKILDINLSTEAINICEVPEMVLDKYIGGRGLGAKILLSIVPRGADPLGPANAMIWMTGPLTGSLVPGSTKHVVITKSPATNSFLDSYSSGGIGFNLVYAGYNGMIVRGKSQKPCYVYIRDNVVEIRDASKLWGMDSYEASVMLLNDIREEGFGHAVIGPAGENLVKFACINNDFFRQAARGGIGAVMGSKNLKAVVAKGTGGVKCYDTEAFLTFHRRMLESAKVNPAAIAHKKAGTSVTFDLTNAVGMLPTKNFQYGTFDPAIGELDSSAYIKKSKGSIACLGCPVPCGKILECRSFDKKKFRIEGPEYETASLLGSNLGISSLDFVSEANIICDRLGMDTISAGNVVGFIMEAYSKGLLDDKEGKVEFGKPTGVYKLLHDIAFRKGIGKWAAEGVAYLAERLGGNALDFAMHTKGLEFPGYDPRRAFGAGLAYAVSPRGACHRRAWPPAKEVQDDFPPYTSKGKALMIKDLYDERNILHSLVVCDFPTYAVPISMDDYNRYLYLVTGKRFSTKKYQEIADRIESTIRYFNYREGLDRSNDTLPNRILKEPILNGPAKGKFIPPSEFEHMLDEYYQIRGWDQSGIPTGTTLEKFDINEELQCV